MRVAFASINGKHLDCSFGQCPSFSIFDFSGNGFRWLESRSVSDVPGEEERLRVRRRLQTIQDCKLLFVLAVDNDAARKAMKAGIMIFRSDPGAEVIPQLERMQQMLKGRPPLWLTKVMRQTEQEESEGHGGK